MADRRRVGGRQRASDDESRLDAIRRRVASFRSDDTPEGVDARTRGDERSAVDARRVEADETAVDSADEADFGDLATSDGSQPRSRVAKAKQRAAEELRERADAGTLTDGAKRALESIAADEGEPDQAPGTTGTQTEAIAKRATDAAAIRSPMGGSLRTVGDERVVTEMARSPAAEGEGLLTGSPLAGRDDLRDRDEPMAAAAGVATFGPTGAGDGMDPMGVEDPFGLTGGGAGDDRADRDSGDEEDPFPGISLTGGDG